MPALRPLSKEEGRSRRLQVAQKAQTGELRFPEAVREMRKALGMTQADFAKHFGLSRLSVIELEKGSANPTHETLQKIAKPFGLQVGFVPTARKR